LLTTTVKDSAWSRLSNTGQAGTTLVGAGVATGDGVDFGAAVGDGVTAIFTEFAGAVLWGLKTVNLNPAPISANDNSATGAIIAIFFFIDISINVNENLFNTNGA
jgi:hypothetical protein